MTALFMLGALIGAAVGYALGRRRRAPSLVSLDRRTIRARETLNPDRRNDSAEA